MSTTSAPSKRGPSSSTTIASPSSTKAPSTDSPLHAQITPTTQPIPAPSTPIGRAYTHIHPLLVSAHFVQRFPLLVADPVPVLLRDLAVLALAQGVYAVICLPPTSAVRGEKKDGEKTAEKKEGKQTTGRRAGAGKRREAGLASRISTALLALLLSLAVATPLAFTGLILLGGPLTTHLPETALCAAHLALLAAPPLFYTRGVAPRAWREAAAALLPGDAVWGGALGAVVGAWLGAVPIPLDWDRAWQRWPVTIVAGAYGGWVAGRALGEYVFWGMRVPMDGE